MIEYNVIKLLLASKEEYLRYHSLLKELSLEREIKEILQLIHKYYQKYEDHEYISRDEFIHFLEFEYPVGKKRETLKLVTENALGTDTSDSLASDVIKTLIEKDIANKIAQEVLPVVSGEKKEALPAVRELLEKYEETVSEQEEAESPFNESELEDILARQEADGITWRLKCLRESIGPLPGGKLLHVFARPETGKSAFLHSEVSFMVGQLSGEQCVLWINNEEEGDVVKLRFYMAVCGATETTIKSNPQKAIEIFNSRGGRRMKLVDTDTISVEEIEKLCNDYKPRIVVIDQGDKVTYKGATNASTNALRLKSVYDKLREVVKRCNREWKIDIITIGQADAACEGKKWLYQVNLDEGKTGKAGAFDFILGIGKTHEASEEGLRFLHTCKKKGPLPICREMVRIDTSRGRYED